MALQFQLKTQFCQGSGSIWPHCTFEALLGFKPLGLVPNSRLFYRLYYYFIRLYYIDYFQRSQWMQGILLTVITATCLQQCHYLRLISILFREEYFPFALFFDPLGFVCLNFLHNRAHSLTFGEVESGNLVALPGSRTWSLKKPNA